MKYRGRIWRRSKRCTAAALFPPLAVIAIVPAGCGNTSGDLAAALGLLLVEGQIDATVQNAAAEQLGTRNAIGLQVLDQLVQAGIRREAVKIAENLVAALAQVVEARLHDELGNIDRELERRLRAFAERLEIGVDEFVNGLETRVEQIEQTLRDDLAERLGDLDPEGELADAINELLEEFAQELERRVNQALNKLESDLAEFVGQIRDEGDALRAELQKVLAELREEFEDRLADRLLDAEERIEELAQRIDEILATAVDRLKNNVDMLVSQVEADVEHSIDELKEKLGDELVQVRERVLEIVEDVEGQLAERLQTALSDIDLPLVDFVQRVEAIVETVRTELAKLPPLILADAKLALDEVSHPSPG